jgi:predicted membrane protein
MHDLRHRQRSRIVFGLFIIGVGLIALLDNLNLFDSRLIRPYWPLVFVVAGLVRLAQWRRRHGALAGVAFIGVGTLLTLHNLGYIGFQVRDWWPVLLILGGISLLVRGPRRRDRTGFAGFDGGRRGRHGATEERLEHGSRVDVSATLAALVLKNDSQDFQGGEISAMMGSVEIDLRQAAIVTEAVLHLSIIMGGVEIKVPRDWSVTVNGMPMLGGIDDKTVPPITPGKRLVVEGSIFMGGVEIEN